MLHHREGKKEKAIGNKGLRGMKAGGRKTIRSGYLLMGRKVQDEVMGREIQEVEKVKFTKRGLMHLL